MEERSFPAWPDGGAESAPEPEKSKLDEARDVFRESGVTRRGKNVEKKTRLEGFLQRKWEVFANALVEVASSEDAKPSEKVAAAKVALEFGFGRAASQEKQATEKPTLRLGAEKEEASGQPIITIDRLLGARRLTPEQAEAYREKRRKEEDARQREQDARSEAEAKAKAEARTKTPRKAREEGAADVEGA